MIRQVFNDNWYFFREGDEGDKVAVTLPHDAMLLEPRADEYLSGKNGCFFRGSDYVYTKSFFVPDEYKDKCAVLEFEGVYRNAEVFINGKLAASRPYGYTNFYVSLNGLLEFGEQNEIKVLAKNSDQPNCRWYSGAGIYRPVSLWTSDINHIKLNGIKIKTLSLDPATIEIKINTVGDGEVAIKVFDTDGKEVFTDTSKTQNGELTLTKTIDSAKFWSDSTPYLYTLKAQFGLDYAETTFGIRTIVCNAQDGYLLNGERVILRGACIHHDNGLLGAITHPYAEARKVRLLKNLGYNAIRSAHNPASKALLDACDRLGMLVMDEYVDMWYIHKNKYDYANYFEDWWQKDLEDMIDKDYNHPSVVIYSVGNEVAESAQEKGIALIRAMRTFISRRDYRPVSCGINIFFNYLSSLGFGVYTDKKADQEIASAGQKKKKKKSVGSEFFNDLAGILGDDVMKIGATLRGSDRKTKKAFSELDIAGYNYGILRYKKDVKRYPNRVILGSETFCKDVWTYYDFAKDHPQLIGDFVWAGMDYLGEVGIGAWEYKENVPDFSFGAGWITAGSGRLDITGKGEGEAAYTRVVYGLDKIRMAVIPVGYKGKHSPSAWKLTNAMESWSWRGYEGAKTDVEVYAYGVTATLYINGKRIKSKAVNKNCRTIFKNVRYTSGEITAEVENESGEKYSATLKTAGEDTRLVAIPEEKAISVSDLCYLRLKYVDKDGIVKPRERGEISINVDNGVLLGFGNGCSYNARGYLTDTADVYYGEALAIIKPVGKGEMTVAAKSGNGNAEVTVDVL